MSNLLPNPDNYQDWQSFARALMNALEVGGIGSGGAADMVDASGITNLNVPAGYQIPYWDISNQQLILSPDFLTVPVAPPIASIDTINLAEASVKVAQLGDGAVTSAKILDATIGSTDIGNAAILTAHIGLLQVVTANIDDAAINDAKIANLAVTSAKIDNLAVTQAKIANLAVGTAQIIDLAVTTAKIGLLAVTAAQIAAATITSAQIAAATIQAANIGAAQITTALIQNGAITSALIADATIGTVDIGSAVITQANMAAASIGSAQIINASITSADIGAAQITTALIANGAITNALIGNAAISNAKIGDLQVTTLKIGDLQVTTDKVGYGAAGYSSVFFDSVNAVNFSTTAWTDVANVSLVSQQGGVIEGMFTCILTDTSGSSTEPEYRLIRVSDGTEILAPQVVAARNEGESFMVFWLDAVNAGQTAAYKMQMRKQSGSTNNVQVKPRYMRAVEHVRQYFQQISLAAPAAAGPGRGISGGGNINGGGTQLRNYY